MTITWQGYTYFAYLLATTVEGRSSQESKEGQFQEYRSSASQDLLLTKENDSHINRIDVTHCTAFAAKISASIDIRNQQESLDGGVETCCVF